MHNPRKTSHVVLAAAALLLSAGSAHAALVNFQFTGNVDFSLGYGGLNNGDTVTVAGVFDDSVLSGGSGTIGFDSGSGNTLSIAAGSYTFTEANDALYTTTGAYITLNSGALFDFNYQAISGINSAPADFDSFFTSFLSDVYLSGTWNTTVQTSPVPVPAAVWLFGSGLLGLMGIARRRKK
jgi:hypothetical protein